MATNSVQGKWNHVEEEEEDEEEEALSLCDLPVINHNDQPRNQEHSDQVNEEFDFRSWGGLFSKEPEMCVADEVFFQGQILPLRHSFSSEAGLLTTGSQHYGKQFINRSESLDHGSVSEFQSSNSSRSSSLRSQNSSSSSSSTTTTTTTTTTRPRIKPQVRNQFHTHPSPKPQLRVSGQRQLASFGNQGRKSSSAWGIFRLGVVPTPEIGLQDLKVRSGNTANKNCVSRNSSSSSSNSISNANSSVKTGNRRSHHGNKNNNVLKQFIGKGGGLLSGCDCSVQSDIVMIKGGTKSSNKTESTTHAVKEKVVELKKQKHRQKQGKKVMSRRRTFEWLKELHASHPDEEALLSSDP